MSCGRNEKFPRSRKYDGWRGIYAFCGVRGECHISKVEDDRKIAMLGLDWPDYGEDILGKYIIDCQVQGESSN